jgi:hypothetical protein
MAKRGAPIGNKNASGGRGRLSKTIQAAPALALRRGDYKGAMKAMENPRLRITQNWKNSFITEAADMHLAANSKKFGITGRILHPIKYKRSQAAIERKYIKKYEV